MADIFFIKTFPRIFFGRKKVALPALSPIDKMHHHIWWPWKGSIGLCREADNEGKKNCDPIIPGRNVSKISIDISRQCL